MQKNNVHTVLITQGWSDMGHIVIF